VEKIGAMKNLLSIEEMSTPDMANIITAAGPVKKTARQAQEATRSPDRLGR